MKMSYMLGRRTKETPADAKLTSHKLLLRAGYIRGVANGIYSSLLPAQKVLKNIENIVRSEMNMIEGQEVEMPLVQPKELWEESGRFDSISDELVRLKDRGDHDMVLAMTHEEAAVALARTEALSYKNYPFMIYQFAKKFRDEARPRGGLIRVREFTMKDAYSFHTSQKDLEDYYSRCAIAYSRIFAKAGIPEVVAIKSDSGMMGGSVSHEYMLLTESGEDTIITCNDCDYKANKEVAVSKIEVANGAEEMKPLEKIHTPNAKTIEELSRSLGLPESRFLKTVFYRGKNEGDKPLAVMIRGDVEINENKLSKVLGYVPEFAGDREIEEVGGVVGFASGYGIAEGCQVIVDNSVLNERNLITGANEKDYHLAGFNLSREMKEVQTVDVASVKEGDRCVHCGGKISLNRGIEVGNIFQLGTKYTDKMGMTFINEEGKQQTPIMGCYGIGIGRLMASVAEVSNDEKGLIWPATIAPWKVAIIMLSAKNDTEGKSKAVSDKIYNELRAKGMDVLYDDRTASAGEKFADADLLGLPLHFVVSPRNLENGVVEYKVRATGEKGTVPVQNATKFALAWYAKELKKAELAADKVMPLPDREVSNMFYQKKNINNLTDINTIAKNVMRMQGR